MSGLTITNHQILYNHIENYEMLYGNQQSFVKSKSFQNHLIHFLKIKTGVVTEILQIRLQKKKSDSWTIRKIIGT